MGYGARTRCQPVQNDIDVVLYQQQEKEMSAWRVMKNGKFFGITETNYKWASKYWAARCTKETKYTLKETT